MADMGRRSIAEKHWNERARADSEWEVKGEADDDEASWIVAYKMLSKPNSKFWKNLERAKDMSLNSSFVKLNVLISDNKYVAYMISKMIEHFGGNVSLFKGLEVVSKDTK